MTNQLDLNGLVELPAPADSQASAFYLAPMVIVKPRPDKKPKRNELQRDVAAWVQQHLRREPDNDPKADPNHERPSWRPVTQQEYRDSLDSYLTSETHTTHAVSAFAKRHGVQIPDAEEGFEFVQGHLGNYFAFVVTAREAARVAFHGEEPKEGQPKPYNPRIWGFLRGVDRHLQDVADALVGPGQLNGNKIRMADATALRIHADGVLARMTWELPQDAAIA